MNLERPNADECTQTYNRSRDVAPTSGICSRCIDGCRGGCEVWTASFRGREVLYPGPFGSITAGADKEYPVDYSHVNIAGVASAVTGPADPPAEPAGAALFTNVDTTSRYGAAPQVTMRLPLLTGALGSTEIARANWEHIATGAAVIGVPVVCGENVCGVDPQLECGADGKVTRSPELERRVEWYRRYRRGDGDLIVQINVEDTRLGVAEYAVGTLGVESIELKWGQGAKCIGGEIQVSDLDEALALQSRGYLVTPDPSVPHVQRAFRSGAVKRFERHSRAGAVDAEAFAAAVDHLRRIGARRVLLKTGAYGLYDLALALKWSSLAKLDLVTIDGASGGTGMSPWRMMQEWGVPTFYLQCMAWELASRLAGAGAFVPDLAMAGGFSTEDHLFKVLALGAPFFKAAAMGRALMIPGMVGKNIGAWIEQDDLPRGVKAFGSTPEAIFIGYESLVEIYGRREVRRMPLGAVATWCFADKLRTGLQQLMAGGRNMAVESIGREDLFCLTEEAARVSHLPYVMAHQREQALEIIDG